MKNKATEWSSIQSILAMMQDVRDEIEEMKQKRKNATISERICIETNLHTLYGLLAGYIDMYENQKKKGK